MNLLIQSERYNGGFYRDLEPGCTTSHYLIELSSILVLSSYPYKKTNEISNYA